ncbi:hypothetical protein KEM60_01968 [Austwickia sp. TVS 96-490-7B]|uniref:Ig-like domain-containing protein n=1 Tax=Austwickia sp. TVS 96-490-7B TaxID=2830843 RepID=UPI001C59BF88|nr:Ig-like domain-containing protein [Austwickia sp. TVS 96-490-7B]MBW3085760.1 hypothetical protein [Austwickia sp. TVS 96-490-7B]
MTRTSKWLRALSALCAVAVTVTIALAIARSPGYDQVRVAPDDGTVWVAADALGMFGRVSLPDGSLDAAFASPGDKQATYQLDLVQAADAVVARDRTAGKLYPVDLLRAKPVTDASATVPSSWAIDAGGNTIAALDPGNGDVRVITTESANATPVGGLSSTSAPAFSVGGDQDNGGDKTPADLAVGVDGRVHAATLAGRVASAHPGQGVEPTRLDLGRRLQSVRVTAVGSDPIVLDARGGLLFLPGGRQVTMPSTSGDLVLQRPGPSSSSVLVAGSKEVWSVSLSDGSVSSMGGQGSGRPARPVRDGRCVVAAWSGDPGVAARGCAADGETPSRVEQVKLDSVEGGLQTPDLRLRGTSLVLNDSGKGFVWDMRTGRRIDDWQRVKPPTTKGASDKDNKDNGTTQPKAPKAVADDYGVRPGRTSVLHVLDNDSDPGGQVIAVSSVTAPSDQRARAVVSPDGQSVQVTTPSEMGVVTFSYTLTDGRGQNSTAQVTLRPRAPEDNEPPNLRFGHQPRSYAVPSGGNIVIPVLADWRDDKDNDPVALVSATSPGLQVSVTKDGRVDVSGAVGAGRHEITYVVGDGRGTTQGKLDVEVLPVGSTSATPPTAMPDFAAGQVGRPVVIRPLDNDLPGADPTSPSARLRLAGDIAAPEGATVTTNRSAGTVTITATHPGTFFMSYSAAYGDAPMAKSSIRVDVTPAVGDAPPVAAMTTAVVRGQGAVTIDVLASSFSPAGRVLAVSRAEAADPGQVQVGVVRGRWVRVQALRPTLSPAQQVIKYTVEDGVNGGVSGTVVLTQLPPLPQASPVTADDHATVRVGDNVTIPVLDDDEDPAGGELTLVQDVPGAAGPGRLPVQAGGQNVTHLGSGYVAGRVVRFQAPPQVERSTTVRLTYLAQNAAGRTAEGHAFVTIEPEPTAARPDQAPEPPEIDGRIVAGDTTTLQISSTGVDPDGDSVSLVGISSAPTLGRVLGMSSNTLTYQAYPTTGGTDSFSYVVQDKYGKRGTGAVRLAVVPPGDPQPPVAINDTVVAAPGSKVLVDALSNDLVTPGDKVSVPDLGSTNGSAPQGVEKLSAKGPFLVTAGTGPQPVTFRYGLTNGIGQASVAAVTVRAQEGYRSAPFAANTQASAKRGDATVTVDVLAKARAANGDTSALHLGHVFAPDVRAEGGRLTVPVGKNTRFVGYEVLDRDGAATMAVLTVPAAGEGAPYPTPDKVVAVPKRGNVTIDIADFVTDPAGRKISVVPGAPLQGSPDGAITAQSIDGTHIRITSATDYVGPAALAVQVTDAEKPGAGDRTTLVALPVQVGPETPVLRCPPSTLTMVAGGQEQRFDVLALCHVWTAKPGDAEQLQFRGQLTGDTAGLQVHMPNGHTLALVAGGDAKEGQHAALNVDVPGTETKPVTVGITVRSPFPPSVAPVDMDGVIAGKTASVNLAGYVSSPLGAAQLSLVSLEQTSGMAAKRDVNGLNVAITPDSNSHGVMTFTVVVSDVADRTRTDRQGRGTITLRVVGPPGAPGAPGQAGPSQNGAVTLGWTVPDNNGAPIDRYRVTWPGGSQECSAVPCTITGLRNGVPQTFTVAAHNAVGWGPESPASAPIMSDSRPGPVRDAKISQGEPGTLVVTWAPPETTGSPVTSYIVTWPGGRVTSSTPQVSIPGLDPSAPLTFTIVAVNLAGPGEPTTVTGQAAGRPATPAAPTLTPTPDGRGGLEVAISWPAVAPNGPGPVTYTVTRSGGGAPHQVCTTTSTSCGDNVPVDGAKLSYSVTAANGAGITSAAGPAAALTTTIPPGQPTNASAKVTPAGKIELSFSPPTGTGSAVSITCVISGVACTGSPWIFRSGDPVTRIIDAVPGGTSLTLTACNADSEKQCAPALTVPVTGELPATVKVNATASGPTVTYEVTSGGAAPGTPVEVTVSTAQGVVETQRFVTAAGSAWNTERSVRVGYGKRVSVKVVLRQASGDRTATSTAQTSAGTVVVAGKMVRGAGQVTVTVSGMAPQASLACIVTNRTTQATSTVRVATDAAGAGSVVVPPKSLPVSVGQSLVATCDASGADPGVVSRPAVVSGKP